MQTKQPVAVHFGAGNIGRGLIGARLQEAGYLVIFADINKALIDALNSAKSYSVSELGPAGLTQRYDNYLALNSQSDTGRLIDYISVAEVITASVGAATLSRISPLIEEGLLRRKSTEPAIVMACENAINASDILFSSIQQKHEVSSRSIFLNTAIDRIIPIQPAGSMTDVWVEPFSEWVIDVSRMNGTLRIPQTIQVDNLEPFIERKLYTVNTAHLAAAYLGQRAGHETIVSSMNDSEIFSQTSQVLEETSAVLRARHGFGPELAIYVNSALERITNPAIDDYVFRVGREPLRKLARNERLIGPAAYFAEHIGEPSGLLSVVDAALSFRSGDDSQVTQLRELLVSQSPVSLVQTVCGIEQDHPLSEGLTRLFDLHKSAISRKN